MIFKQRHPNVKLGFNDLKTSFTCGDQWSFERDFACNAQSQRLFGADEILNFYCKIQMI